MRVLFVLLVLSISVFATAAMLSAAQEVDRVVTEEYQYDGIPPYIKLDIENCR